MKTNQEELISRSAALGECLKNAERQHGSVGARDCIEIREAIRNLPVVSSPDLPDTIMLGEGKTAVADVHWPDGLLYGICIHRADAETGELLETPEGQTSDELDAIVHIVSKNPESLRLVIRACERAIGETTPLPDDVEAMAKKLRLQALDRVDKCLMPVKGAIEPEAADMLERVCHQRDFHLNSLGRHVEKWREESAAFEQRIAELEHELNDARSGRMP